MSFVGLRIDRGAWVCYLKEAQNGSFSVSQLPEKE